MPPFRLVSDYLAKGDQPGAIGRLTDWLAAGRPHVALLGVTGSGKTFTVASVIERLQRPTLVISPNKTLAAQLYSEFKAFFPENAVEYFVSYYDYYQPEAYIPQSDTYIEKDALVNDEIDRMRHSATKSLLERRDVVVVASVGSHMPAIGQTPASGYEGEGFIIVRHRETAKVETVTQDDKDVTLITKVDRGYLAFEVLTDAGTRTFREIDAADVELLTAAFELPDVADLDACRNHPNA